MINLKEEILNILDQDFAYQDTDWITAASLLYRLKERKLKPSMPEIVKTLQELSSKGSIEFSPTIIRDSIQGFLVRLAVEGHNIIHYGRPSVIRK